MSRQPWVFDFAFAARVGDKGQQFALNIACQSRARRLAVVGASGSGKSLSLQFLSGLLRPQHGHVHIEGRAYGDTARGLWLPPQARRVGLVFQDYALFPHLTVAQNIAFGLHRNWRNPPCAAAAATREWLARMQLTAVAGHYPHQISGGQQQRTALAHACIGQPRWLLLDEPFSALDAQLRGQMRALTAQLQQELNIPLLLVSHDAEDTRRLADEVWQLADGGLRRV